MKGLHNTTALGDRRKHAYARNSVTHRLQRNAPRNDSTAYDLTFNVCTVT